MGQPELTVEVPLHARYGSLSLGDRPGYHTIRLEQPIGFWACPASKHSNIPHEVAPHIRPELFPKSAISIIPHAPSATAMDLVIPVGSLADLTFVDVGTAAAILFCFLYLSLVSLRTAHRLYQAPNMLKTE
ncbi:hypothetical protein DAEQUDRAFT_729840 [Daedalea quercina L-15889]|uniref:Protein PBN1 n=1 Tax=Daedalea quercina L-15889 TaxID=1314783 RepID=A0A165NEP3_9APHY|nr:hypothetical protein DAEQUDRAFT_729840 [Daedalea quercina L-15889]